MALVYSRWESSSARSFPTLGGAALWSRDVCYGYITNLSVGYFISLLCSTDLLTLFISLAEAGQFRHYFFVVLMIL